MSKVSMEVGQGGQDGQADGQEVNIQRVDSGGSGVETVTYIFVTRLHAMEQGKTRGGTRRPC